MSTLQQILVQSICGPLATQIKGSFAFARKNKDLANNNDFR
jgi:hypothetical protein